MLLIYINLIIYDIYVLYIRFYLSIVLNMFKTVFYHLLSKYVIHMYTYTFQLFDEQPPEEGCTMQGNIENGSNLLY